MRVIVCVAMATSLTIALERTTDGEQAAAPAEDLLRGKMGLTAHELAELRAGRAVVKSLAPSARNELAQLGVITIGLRSDEFVARIRDIERFEYGPGTPQIGRFSDPPRITDLASLRVPEEDLKALRSCRPGHCDLKLSAASMKRVNAQVNWNAADATAQANEAMRRLLFDLVLAYQARGDEALEQYDDGATSWPIHEEFNGLASAPVIVPVAVEPLLRYLNDYPRYRLENVEEFFYWSVVHFGLKPTIRLNHVAIYPLTEAPLGVTYAIATKQVYASHYFHTTLELRFLLNRSGASQHGIYVLSILRSRNDGMTGLSGTLLRPIISRRSRAGIRRYLEYLQAQMAR